MTFDTSKYFEIINTKYANFGLALNQGFNTLNNTKPIESVNERVATLHSLILNKQEFDKNYFTEEEYKQEEIIAEEETKRLNDLISGTLKPYIPSEEDLELLLISKDDLYKCFLSEQEYLDAIKDFNKNG